MKNLQTQDIQRILDDSFTKDKIISILTHDLKSSVGAINSIASYLNSDYDRFKESDKKKLIQSITFAAIQTTEILENTFWWAYIKLQKNLPDRKKTDLKELINSVKEQLQEKAESKSIDIINHISKQCYISVDEEMLKIAFKNIISNAIKFSFRNSSINIDIQKIKYDYHISITDKGIGMKKADLKKLFDLETNFRGLGTNDESGPGFGLIVSKEFIEINNGKIQINSQFRKGTIVSVILPANIRK